MRHVTGAAPTYRDLLEAAGRVDAHIRRTPVFDLGQEVADDVGVDVRVVLKLELLQHTGSFKARGALNALLARQVPAGGVVAASGGNHGAAVAWAAARVGIPARVFVPATSPPLKARRVSSYGADVEIVPGYYPDALSASREWADGRDVAEVHAYDAPEVVAGQGTLGLELATQVPDASTVLVSCGGGGLYAGVALALGDRCTVIPVEPSACPTLATAIEAGTPVTTAVGGIAADSMGAATAGRIAHAVAVERGVRPILVPDEAILAARAYLWERCRILAEPGGATAFAALLSGALRPAPGTTVVAIVSGGNTLEFPAASAASRTA